MRHLAFTLSCAIAGANAQSPATRPAPTLHLPAASHSVEQLLQLISQAVRKPIQLGEDVDLKDRESLRLQNELVLPIADWEDCLSALLTTRGLVLTYDAAHSRYEVKATPTTMTDWLEERALSLRPEQLAARPDLRGPVSVVVPTKTKTAMLVNMLRPYLAGNRTGFAYKEEAEGLRITGLAQTVRFAMGVFAGVDATLLAVWPPAAPLPWPRPATGSHRLEAGDFTPTQLLDLLAAGLARNVIVPKAVAALDAKVTSAAPFQGDDLAFEAKVTALLWQSNVLVVSLAPKYGVFEAMFAAAGTRLPDDRSAPMSGDEVLARPDLVALVTVSCALGALSQQEAVGKLRPLMQRGKTVTMAAVGPGLSLQGLTCDLVPFLRALEPAPAATKPDK